MPQKISEYALDRRLPDGISSRIKRHFRYFYFKTSVFDERAVMEHVPWQICQEVMSKTHAVAISATGLLQVRQRAAGTTVGYTVVVVVVVGVVFAVQCCRCTNNIRPGRA